MDLASAPVDVQMAAFDRLVLTNPVVVAVVERLVRLDLPQCYLAAGALFQTVWNGLSERDPTEGINDYDVNYYDDTDLSWHAEDQVIGKAAAVFADLDATVEVRNEARVHLWYEDKFGVPCPPYPSVHAAIASFPNTSSCFGVRAIGRDRLEVYAPYGFSDLFAMRTRPNPILAPSHVYEAKTARWKTEWPSLQVLPWPTT